jgi:hypothetical protein
MLNSDLLTLRSGAACLVGLGYVSPVLEPTSYAVENILGLMQGHWIQVEMGGLNQLFQLTHKHLSYGFHRFHRRFLPFRTGSLRLNQSLNSCSDLMQKGIRLL